ncbi:bifunctional diguanylate cyclase/phosphodiesterase [Legionella bononiensis]|uniref:EAL domain-containing protein n=1 Tax=Legionella bononiensis TaxID=2793102 RepID=A0ABS1WC15_9GAMM|nr:EAL domain-containing protein [Legionella bononiensis]MBL7481155.1 EAL domain-containing protein [Legionella bononiensis]MBL7526864.1 EAL domain-containing protein [Legionella bononiensis]MBL7564271.1 EAL domain-containing protein [Legionella bononiensis]
MENSFVFNEANLKRIPQFLVLIIILLLGLPYVGLYFGLDFSTIANKLNKGTEFNSFFIESQIRGYFRQTLLQWSGFSLAAVTVLLAFTQYRLSNDKIALIIGLAVLFSGSTEALHTLVIDGLSLEYKEKNNLDALIWIFSNSISGLILGVGLIMLITSSDKQNVSFTTFILLTTFLVLTAITIIYYATGVIELPEMWFSDLTLSRPYELISVFIYLILMIFIYPKAYKTHPNILVDCIFYMAVTQIVTSFYIMILSSSPYDSAYNIAYVLKLVGYFIPCTCLVINYVFSYTAVLKAQKALKIKQDELTYIASHDSLTNLYNRREFEVLLNKAISSSARTHTSVALLLIDMDNFKATNDTFGHVHGDELLRQFSMRLILLTRKGDILSRVGGDEFTLISPNLKTHTSARQLAERILNELNSPYPINGKLITVTVSIGISIYPDDGTNSDELLIRADLAMYKAKRSGKNTYQFYTEQLSYLQHRESEVEAHLRKALQNDEFELYYQPKFNLLTMEIVGAEVLLRWNSDTLGHVSPNEFIPVAETTGLIIDLGLWIIRKSSEQIMKWMMNYTNKLAFSINISPIQLANNQFLKNLKNTLKDSNFPSEHMELEITESLLMGDNEDVNSVLNGISSLGVKISLDDFGKGYSSLSRLKMLPIDTLKIDKDFVSDIHNEKDKVVLVDIIIKLAHELGMSIVAEGIETAAQLKYLIAKKCQIGQGFLLSKPLPADQFEEIAYVSVTENNSFSEKSV